MSDEPFSISLPDESFPLLAPIEIKHVCVKAIATIQSLTLGQNAIIRVKLLTEDDTAISVKMFILEGQDYDNWGSDDLYIQTYVQNKLAEEANQ